MQREGMLRYSRWDALLIVLSFLHGIVLLLAPSIPLIAFGLWWNSNTISHNFIHHPFFRLAGANRVYSVYLTLLLGYPQSLWRERHLAHHSGLACRIRISPTVTAEATLVLSMWMLLLARSPQLFLGVYLPGYVVGLGLCYVHGYFEHAHGTKSNYGLLYNASFFNDGYHVEHHAQPIRHWTRLPDSTVRDAKTSRWPPILRWIEAVKVPLWIPVDSTGRLRGIDMISRRHLYLKMLECLERLVLRSQLLQRFLLNTHERALRQLMPELPVVRTVQIVGGGMFPRTAILIRRLLPNAEITIIDTSAESIRAAKTFIAGNIRYIQECFEPVHSVTTDLVVIPLTFIGDRESVYRNPPAPAVLVHDWIWARRGALCKKGVVISPWLLKRLNLIQ